MPRPSPPFPGGTSPQTSARGGPRRCPPWPSSAWTPRWSGRWGGWASPPGPAPAPGPSEPASSGARPQTPTGRPKDSAASPWTPGGCLSPGEMGKETELLISLGAFSGRHTLRRPQNGSTSAGGGKGEKGTCPPWSCQGRPGLRSGPAPAGFSQRRPPPRLSCANKKHAVGRHRAIHTVRVSGARAAKHRP